MSAKGFPILYGSPSRRPANGPATIPWAMIAPHERQARANHGGQTLTRLAERGGLSCKEAVAVLNDESYYDLPTGGDPASWAETLNQLVALWSGRTV